MGKGLAKRRRLMNALKARTEKRGKAHIGGQAGHKKRKQNESDYVPASFRKLMTLKVATEQQEQKKQRLAGGQVGLGRASHAASAAAVPASNVPAQQGAAPQGDQDRDATGAQHAQQDVSQYAGRPVEDAERGQQAQQHAQAQQQGKRGKGALGSSPADPPGRDKQQAQRAQQDTGLFKKKALRADKKEFLKLKKLRKAGKLKGGPEGGEGSKEAELRQQEVASRPQFGEQAVQPIQANLKRRHWADQERSAAERCKQVFMKQMEGATAAAAAAVAATATAAVPSSGGGILGKVRARQRGGISGKAGAAGKAGSPVGGLPEQSRQEAIQAYREAKRRRLAAAAGQGEGGSSATAESLAMLVRREKRRVAAQKAAAGGGGGA